MSVQIFKLEKSVTLFGFLSVNHVAIFTFCYLGFLLITTFIKNINFTCFQNCSFSSKENDEKLMGVNTFRV